MNRRQALSEMGRTALAACGLRGTPLAAACGPDRSTSPLSARCPPLISGLLWWFDAAWSAESGAKGWSEELQEQKELGFDLLWLTGVRSGLDHPDDPLRLLLDLCAKQGTQVILDTGSSARWYLDLQLEQELALCGENIRRIGQRFAGHPAFYAWYVPHEIYMNWDAGRAYIEGLYPALVERCKRAASLPVTLSPFFILDRDKVFGDFRYPEPDEYRRFWSGLIRRSAFDVIMLQDSGEHFSYVTNEQRRPFFAAMKSACADAGARLWGNVETAEFECPSIAEYIRRYGRIHHATVKNPPWRPVPLPRLREKLELAAQYCERIVTWGYQQFCRPSLGPAAKQWYEEYRKYASAVRGRA